METIIIYLLKASGLTLLFFMAYHCFLRRETFFTGNRWFLLAGLATSALLPLIIFTKMVWVAPAPAVMPVNLPKVITGQNNIIMPQPETFTVSWQQVLTVLYSIGLVSFMARFIYDIIKIHTIIKKHKFVHENGFKIIDSENIPAPFSFFRYIAYNSKGLQHHELQSIINHEKVHSRQWHSLDMIIAHLFCVMLWFNPFVWLYKKAIAQNLEFIADDTATEFCDKTQYQKTLLKITVQQECITITNNFYQSLIKKRIIMLNKQPSKKISAVKYAFIVPVLCVFMYLFQTESVARQLNTPAGTFKVNAANLEINKDITDAVLKQNELFFKTPFNTDVNFSEIKRNKKGEIINIEVKVTDGKQTKQFSTGSKEPITTFYIVVQKNEDGTNEIAIGRLKNIVTSKELSIPFRNAVGIDKETINVYGHIQYVSESGGNFKLSNDGNSGFIVTMKTTDKALEYYKKELMDINVEFNYSEIKRDKNGNIMHLRMDVIDRNEKTPLKASTLTMADDFDKGISDIYIGRRDGKVIAGGPNG